MEKMIEDYLLSEHNEFGYSDCILKITGRGAVVTVEWKDTFYDAIKSEDFSLLEIMAWVYSQIPVVTNR